MTQNWLFLGYLICYGFLVNLLQGIEVDQFCGWAPQNPTITIFAVSKFLPGIEVDQFCCWAPQNPQSLLSM